MPNRTINIPEYLFEELYQVSTDYNFVNMMLNKDLDADKQLNSNWSTEDLAALAIQQFTTATKRENQSAIKTIEESLRLRLDESETKPLDELEEKRLKELQSQLAAF